MTTKLLRRQLLALAASSSVLAVTACQSGNKNLAEAAEYIHDIANGLLAILPNFAGVPGVTPALIAQIGQWVADLQKAAAAIGAAANATSAETVVRQVEADVNAIVGAVAGFAVIPGPISAALTAATFLLPIIEAAINMLLPTPPVAPVAVAGVPPVALGAVAKGRARFKAPAGYTAERAVADLRR